MSRKPHNLLRVQFICNPDYLVPLIELIKGDVTDVRIESVNRSSETMDKLADIIRDKPSHTRMKYRQDGRTAYDELRTSKPIALFMDWVLAHRKEVYTQQDIINVLKEHNYAISTSSAVVSILKRTGFIDRKTRDTFVFLKEPVKAEI